MWTRTSDPPIHPAFVLLSCVNFQKKKKGDKVWAWNSAWKCPPPRSHPTQIVIMIIETPARYNPYCVRNHNLEPPTHPPFWQETEKHTKNKTYSNEGGASSTPVIRYLFNAKNTCQWYSTNKRTCKKYTKIFLRYTNGSPQLPFFKLRVNWTSSDPSGHIPSSLHSQAEGKL